MLSSRFLAQVAVPFLLVLRASAESHVIKFVNQCGFGSPALMYNGENILAAGSDTYTSNGVYSGIAYLQTGYCNVNGENCTLLETTLINPTCVGCGSATDLSLIPPHAYSVQTSFAYYNGCDGSGKTCSNATCTDDAFFDSDDNFVQVACQTDDVNLLIAFCADAAQLVTGGSSPTTSPSGGSSTPGSVTPPTDTPTPTPTVTPTGTDSDPGCDEPGETTPPSTPTPTPTTPTTSPTPTTPATTPTPTTPATTPTPTTPTTSPTPATPTTSPSGSPTTCRPRPTTVTPTVSPTPAQRRRHRRTHRIRY